MLTVIAIGFPVIAIIVAWILARPQEVLRRFPAVAGREVDRSALPARTHFWWAGGYLTLTYCIAAITAIIQHLLFREASPGTSWTFSSRLTDSWMFAFIPGLFGGMLIAFPLHVRVFGSAPLPHSPAGALPRSAAQSGRRPASDRVTRRQPVSRISASR